MALVVSISGIRGIFGKDFDEKSILLYALAYLELLKEKIQNPVMVIGRDTRASGKAIRDCLINCLDCRIIDVGISSTPIIENAVRVFNADCGIIITASHNEPEYNGFKFLENSGTSISPDIFNKFIEKYNKIKDNPEKYLKNYDEHIEVEVKEKEAVLEYIKFIKTILGDKVLSSVKILVDPNGGSGTVSKKIFEDFGINADYINMEEGKFKRIIEPNEISLGYLKKFLENNKYDFALGFDCDADRVEILLNNGKIISGNHLLALICRYVLEKNTDNKNKTKVVVNNATSYVVKEIVEKYANFVEVEVGETNVVNKMKELNSVVGGEGSSGGVIIWPSRCRDGILTCLFLLKILTEKNVSLENLIENLPDYFYLREKLGLKKDFSEFKGKIKEYYLNKCFKVFETDKGNGFKIIDKGSWILFRQSNTEDKILRVIVDSKSEENSKNLLAEAKKLIESY
jgi:phosphomannomutase